MSTKLSGKCGTEYLNTIPLPILLCAGYKIKPVYFILNNIYFYVFWIFNFREIHLNSTITANRMLLNVKVFISENLRGLIKDSNVNICLKETNTNKFCNKVALWKIKWYTIFSAFPRFAFSMVNIYIFFISLFSCITVIIYCILLFYNNRREPRKPSINALGPPLPYPIFETLRVKWWKSSSRFV